MRADEVEECKGLMLGYTFGKKHQILAAASCYNKLHFSNKDMFQMAAK